jgi:hypothetical protein
MKKKKKPPKGVRPVGKHHHIDSLFASGAGIMAYWGVDVITLGLEGAIEGPSPSLLGLDSLPPVVAGDMANVGADCDPLRWCSRWWCWRWSCWL